MNKNFEVFKVQVNRTLPKRVGGGGGGWRQIGLPAADNQPENRHHIIISDEIHRPNRESNPSNIGDMSSLGH